MVVDNPWLFTMLYLGGVLVMFAVLAGGFFVWLRRQRRSFDEELELRAAREPEPEIQLKNLENQIEKLIRVNTEMNERLKWMEGQLSALMAQGGRPGRKVPLHEQVYQAFDRGKPVTELARQFGRHKGEIELMLNLRRMRREGESG
ncbi:hypothetical protein [Candidatus Desulforudis audaxviator]|uniref:DUF2802 domain-containing protein n=1 Tax=Desulforudis audaxviator (strain MP104C) TaxID=477974 RepID=B1I5J2_DESAP|nr:hypothetical protein [Candidatus Desulforudis audaxviator]ACA60239.1 hypothetical protein Daud_1743 [Candidatus Desulforudis audaxviator MP104C]